MNKQNSGKSRIKRLIRFINRFSLRTIYFNFKYLPVKQAIKLPIFLSRHVYLREISGKIILDCKASPRLINIGFGDVGIFDDKVSRTILCIKGTLIFKGSAGIGHGSKISIGPDGILELGENFCSTAESTIVAFDKIVFGNDCLLSWDTLVMDTDFHSITDENQTRCNEDKPIEIGEKVWIGCRTLILKGVTIPDNCVIGANSFITRSINTPNCVYAGNPIKKIKENTTWES